MQGIEINKKHKYNLGSAFALVVGNVVGAGIFVKNKGIIDNTHSVWLTALTWFIGGVIIVSMALALIEIISTNKSTNNGGVVAWGTKFVNHRFGRTVMWFMYWIYLPIMIMSLAYYGAYYTLPMLSISGARDINGHLTTTGTWIMFAITIFYLVVLGSVNALTFKPGNVIQMIAIILTLIPLIIIVIIGLCTKNASNIPKAHTYLHHSKGLSGVIVSLPSVLFAFDGFYYVTNIKGDLKNPRKNLTLSLILGLLFVSLLYILISVAIFSINLGSDAGDAIKFSHHSFNGVFEKFVGICIIMGSLGGLNGYILSGARMVRHGARYNLLPLKKHLIKSNKIDVPHGSTFAIIGIAIVFTIFSFLFGTLAKIGASNIDGGVFVFINDLSNWQTLLIFIFIGIIIAGAVVNRFTKKIEVDKRKYFMPAAIITVLALIIIPIWNIYSTIVGAFTSSDVDIRQQDIVLLVILIVFISIIIIGAYWDKIFRTDRNKKEWSN